MTTTSRRTVLVLGANGRFGLAAAQAFGAAGWTVLAHVRRDAAAGMPARARLVRGPLETLAEAMPPGDEKPGVVVHGLNPVYTRWDQEALPMARAAMDLAERLGARFMLPGNVYNYGSAMPARIDASTPQRPSTPKGRLRCTMEGELAARAAAGRLVATVITAGDFFGGGTGSWLDLAVVKSIAAGKLVYPGPLDVVHPWAYLPDLAQAFVAAAGDEGAAPFERFCFAGHALTGAQFLDATERAARALGIAPPGAFRRGGMPWWLIRAGGAVVPMWRELARMSYLWRVPHALDGSRLAARFPALAATPIDAALAASLIAIGAAPGRRRPDAAPADLRPVQ